MRRLVSLLLLFSFGTVLSGQSLPRLVYELQLDHDQQQLKGNCQINFVNTTGQKLDRIYLHLPPNALASSKSLLRRQFVEYQKTELHFADSSETGYLKHSNWSSKRAFRVEDSLEWAVLHLQEPLSVDDSIALQFDMELQLAPLKLFGSGFSDDQYRLIDWLPRTAAIDNKGWHPYPLSWQRDVYPTPVQFELSLHHSGGFQLVSNADSVNIETSDTATQHQLHHRGNNLQIYLGDFQQMKLSNGQLLFSDKLGYGLSAVLSAYEKTESYLKSAWGFAPKCDILLLDEKDFEYQSDQLISIKYDEDIYRLSVALMQARAEQWLRYHQYPDGFMHPWLARGLPYFYKYDFIAHQYPDKNWLSFQNRYTGFLYNLAPGFFNWLEWISGMQEFDKGYQNEFLFHFLSRQGLDQAMATPVDSLSRLNYEAIVQAKAFLSLRHLRAYVGEREFKRSLHRYMLNDSTATSPALLEQNLAFYSNKPLSWYFDRWIHSDEKVNFSLKEFEYCPTITVATVKNNGDLAIPYSLTGYKDGEPVLTEWFDGHEGEKKLLMYHADYDKVVLNDHGYSGEYDRRDNSSYDRILFKGFEPLKVRFYQSFENPDHSQLMFLPVAGYNDYDKLLLGLMLYNESFVKKGWEYQLAPQYSFGEKELMGSGSLEYNLIPQKSSPFRRIKSGIYGRYFHYDEDLSFQRISPAIRFYLRKPYPTSTIQREIILRSVHVDRQLDDDFQGSINKLNRASYDVLNLGFRLKNTNVLHPHFLNADFLYAENFSRVSVEGDFRRLLPNRRWLIWRNYAGLFFHNQFAEEGLSDNFYSIGLSGTRDFMFDYSFLGRSATEGWLSRQFFTTDGGFKSATDVYAESWMFTSNLSMPLWKFIGAFGDVGLVDGHERLYYDYGIRLAFITDFVELYLPIGSHQDPYILDQPNYSQNIRFVLNLDYGAILERIRWGFY